ncbi:metallophosphoesterase [Leptospira kanakyensis]|uniref:metallophosphoesterase n=1 Tax=Leptospira kanakyensis TaxID=2484968 RepID=UPI00223DCA86|nr:metallophosphoesterase [Leptospira kanakyensis]MCW7469267.1 metallophosphoesterase [Leptospira kanakyensis]
MKLEIGYNFPFEIRKETYQSNCNDDFSILFLSDLHFNGFNKTKVYEIIKKIEELNPTIILFGGDYIDSNKGLIQLKLLLLSLSHRKNLFAIAGNHDYFFGIDKIKECMEVNNVFWLEKQSFTFQINNTTIRIVGNLLKTEEKEFDFSILVLHNPKAIDNLKDNHHSAFAGHLHGCQFVFWENKNGLYPGKFFYKWNTLKAMKDDCQFFISKGLGDTLPIRFNCKRDMIFLQVNGIQDRTIF